MEKLRQAINTVKIEGILSEVDIERKTLTKDGKTQDAIGGTIKVKVAQVINGENTDIEIPVHMFATKYTKAGAPNPAYDSIEKVLTEYTSIAAAGGEDKADIIRITKGNLRMNEYHKNGVFYSSPRIHTSFLERGKKEKFNPEATFEVQMVVGNKVEEVDSDGVATGRLKVSGIVPQYGGTVDIFDFIAANDSVRDAIEQMWQKGDTVPVLGKLNFSSKTETTTQEVAFGEPVTKTRTISMSELVITGGNFPLEGELAYDVNQIGDALAERKARLEKDKAESEKKTAKKPSPAQSAAALDNLGF